MHIINLISSSSPNSSFKRPQSSLLIPSSSASITSSPLGKGPSFKRSRLTLSSSLSQQCNLNVPRYEGEIEFDTAAYEQFKEEWNNRRRRSLNNDSPIKRRASDTFTVVLLESSSSNVVTSPRIRSFRNKNEAISSIRIVMSSSMAEAYEGELRRRFNERQMIDCLPLDTSNSLIPPESGSFRWKFHDDSLNGLVRQRLFIIDSERIWDEFIVSRRFKELLDAYNEPDVFLYFMNWKRAAQKHTNHLNRLFKQSVTSNEPAKLLPANELENDFFLTAADLRLKVNFGMATTSAQSLMDLMDFVIEMTRVVALSAHIEETHSNENNSLITLPRHVKVPSGKDVHDSWIKILCQIPRLTVPFAELIASRYPSFHSLMEAFDCCPSRSVGENLLANLKQDDRKIGPVLSRRIYLHFSQ
jgi:hypothetical protein